MHWQYEYEDFLNSWKLEIMAGKCENVGNVWKSEIEDDAWINEKFVDSLAEIIVLGFIAEFKEIWIFYWGVFSLLGWCFKSDSI